MPTIKFIGAVKTVTGSNHLVTNGRSEILLDAGLFQGSRDESYRINTTFQYNPHKIDALIVSHAHMDHSGNIPTLVNHGLRAKIYSTGATRDLCRLMLEDSGNIQEEDIRYVNKINRSLGLPMRKPLYTKRDALKAAKRFHAISYNRRFCVAKNSYVTLYDAGHVLGSAVVALELKTETRDIRLGYAVDLGRKGLPLLKDPVAPRGLDYLVIESTYGARLHPPAEEAKAKLREVVNRTVERGGKILIPSFALERTQEVIYYLSELLKEKQIPQIPVYIDSPLAIDLTEVFRINSDYLDEEVGKIVNGKDSPFDGLNLHYVRDQNESKRLNIDKRPMIIIAGSGMCESGRILHHLKNNIEDSRNTVLVVGYMARDTLGKKIVEKMRIVRIFGVEYELNAEVAVINAFSGHADRRELCDFVSRCLPLRKVFLVHGDEDQMRVLAESLSGMGVNVYIPSPGEEIELT